MRTRFKYKVYVNCKEGTGTRGCHVKQSSVQFKRFFRHNMCSTAYSRIDRTVTLRNGVQVPIIGLGTTHHGGYVHETIVHAIKAVGYRHLDTAKRYGVETFIRQAIEASGVDRSRLFLATKLWPKDYGKDNSMKAALGSMERLGTDYLDLYMLHWPVVPLSAKDPTKCLAESWRDLELLYDSERIRALGVSNFGINDLEHLMNDCMEVSGIVPHVNQCECHPYQNPKRLRDYCQDHGIQFEGHCPLAKGTILDREPIVRIAKQVKRTPAQVCIRWSIQNNIITIPKSTKKDRVLENYESLEFILPEEAMRELDNLHSDLRVLPLENFQKRLETEKPDGYKIVLYPSSFPTLPYTKN